MVTILVSARITFLTLLEYSVILYDTRITFLSEKSNSRWHEKSNSQCWYIPSKLLNMSFSPLNSRHLSTALGEGGGCLNPSITFPIQSIREWCISWYPGQTNVTIHPPAPEHSTFNKKRWHEMAIYAVLSQDQLWQIWDMPDFFCIFWHPSSWPICQILMYILRSRAAKPLEMDWIWCAHKFFGVKFWRFSFF